jgi:phenylpropionate dioxygenase-like ring-hydroxylating dioxygenase large terminal subunit
VSRRPDSAFLDAAGDYPLIERYGYAWVWYGNPLNASSSFLPCIPHTPVDGLPRRFEATVIYDCTYELVCENLLDLTHADFLHSKLTGDALSEDDVIDVYSTSETVTMIRTAHGRPVPQMQKALAGGAETQNVRAVTITYVRSGLCVLHGDFNPGMSMPMIHPTNPETRERCRVPATFNPRYMPWFAKAVFPFSSYPVGRQDNWALRKQNAKYVGSAHPEKQDLSSRFDKAGLRYRKVYQQLAARQRDGDFTYLPDAGIDRDTSDELGINSRA